MKKSLQARLAALGGVAALASVSSSAFAVAPTTLGDLTTSVNFDSVGLAVLAISAAIIPMYVIWKGSKFVLRAIKGA